jgi:CDP-diacylglycerol--serine O-phosphatidyltransferase
MIGYYNRSVVLTYLSVIISVYGVFYALESNYTFAVLALMVCGLCDMFDGTIASKTKRSEPAKKFGVQIDSLCDLLNFGVFPAIIGYAMGLRHIASITCMVLFILAAVIRLGYFNVDEDLRQQEEGDQKRAYYRGLPVTSVAMIIPVFLLINAYLLHREWTVFYPVLLLALAILFVLDFKVKKPKGPGIWIMAFSGLIIFYLVLKFGQSIGE